MNLMYTYGGLVEGNKDPLKLGRIKVRVPHVYGSTGGGSGFVATNDLPWALPAGMPAGGSAKSGGFTQIPEVGDKVWVRFLDGEPEKPIWEWGMQSYDDSKVLKLHSYALGADGSTGGPDRTAWTRYSHAIELNDGGMILTTSGGYRLLLNDSSTPVSFDGSIKLSTPHGNMLEIDDDLDTLTLNILQDVNFQIGNSFSATSFDYTWNTTDNHTTNIGGNLEATVAGDTTFSGVGDYTVDSLALINLNAGTTVDLTAGTDMTLTAGGVLSVDVTGELDLTGAAAISLTAGAEMSLTSAAAINLDFLLLSLGTGSTEPFVLGNQIFTYLDSLVALIAAHVHSDPQGGVVGAMTPIPTPPTPALLSKVIFGH